MVAAKINYLSVQAWTTFGEDTRVELIDGRPLRIIVETEDGAGRRWREPSPDWHTSLTLACGRTWSGDGSCGAATGTSGVSVVSPASPRVDSRRRSARCHGQLREHALHPVQASLGIDHDR